MHPVYQLSISVGIVWGLDGLDDIASGTSILISLRRSAAVHPTRIRSDRWIGMRSFLEFRSQIGFETIFWTGRDTLPKIDK